MTPSDESRLGRYQDETELSLALRAVAHTRVGIRELSADPTRLSGVLAPLATAPRVVEEIAKSGVDNPIRSAIELAIAEMARSDVPWKAFAALDTYIRLNFDAREYIDKSGLKKAGEFGWGPKPRKEFAKQLLTDGTKLLAVGIDFTELKPTQYEQTKNSRKDHPLAFKFESFKLLAEQLEMPGANRRRKKPAPKKSASSGGSAEATSDPSVLSVRPQDFDLGYTTLSRHSTMRIDPETPRQAELVDDFEIAFLRDGTSLFRRYLKWATEHAEIVGPPEVIELGPRGVEEPSTDMRVLLAAESSEKGKPKPALVKINGEPLYYVFLGRNFNIGDANLAFRLKQRFACTPQKESFVASPRYVDLGSLKMTLEIPASWAGPHLDFTARPAGASEKTATWDERSPKSLVGPMGTAIVIRHKANKSLVVATWEITNPDKWTEYRITYHQHREPGRSR